MPDSPPRVCPFVLVSGTHPDVTDGAVRRLRVLIIDEHSDAANSLADLLKLMGADARACHSGPEAESLADTFRPHAWLIEPRGRGWDGFEFARRVRLLRGSRPLLVALTVLAGPGAAARASAAGSIFISPSRPTRAMWSRCWPISRRGRRKTESVPLASRAARTGPTKQTSAVWKARR